MSAYAWPHEFDDAREVNDARHRPGVLKRLLKVLISILSGGDSGWEAGARGL
jgi:hypothetical protein